MSWYRLGIVLIAAMSGSALAETDDPDIDPPVTRNDLLVVRHAEQILASPTAWNRHDDRVCKQPTKTYSLYCALKTSANDLKIPFSHRSAVMQQARFLIDRAFAPRNRYQHRLMDFNNDPETDFSKIGLFLRSLDAHLTAELQSAKTAD